MKDRKHEHGFTLIEMLVVLGIIAMVAAISIPYTKQGGDRLHLRATARSITAILQRQRFVALSENVDQHANFDLETGMLTDGKGAKLLVIPRDTKIAIITARQDTSATKAAIRFFADGGSSGGTISLSKGNQTVAVKVNWFTGATIVEERPSQ